MVLWGLLQGSIRAVSPTSDVSLSLSLSPCLLVCDSLPLKVTDSSTRRSDGTAGRMIDTQTLKELQTHIGHVRELGRTATERLNQVRGLYHGCLSENMYVTPGLVLYSRPEVPNLWVWTPQGVMG